MKGRKKKKEQGIYRKAERRKWEERIRRQAEKGQPKQKDGEEGVRKERKMEN